MQRIILLSITSLTLIGFLSSCKVGPEYQRPEIDFSEQKLFVVENLEENLGAKENQKNSKDISLWWKRIEDPTLDKYVDQLLKDNLSIKAAAQRIIQSQENVKIQQGGLFPTLSVAGSGGRNFFQNPFQGQGAAVNNYSADLKTSWEIDLFGKIRKSIESKSAEFEATKFDKIALEQSLIAQLVKLRISIAINNALVDLAKSNIDNQKRIYDLVKYRYDVGAKSSSLLDVYLAENSYNSVKSDIHIHERILLESLYKFDILLGKPPGSTKIDSKSFPLIAPPNDVNLCFPASLIDRRPDIRSSELKLISSNADIGIAIADLYPDLSISGSVGLNSNSLNNFFSSQNLVESLIGNITNKIFQGGALKANIKLKESRAKELAFDYSQDILQAFFEVENALANEREITLEIAKKQKSVNALQKAEKISYSYYSQGIESLQSYLEVQLRRYKSEQNLLNSDENKWNNRIDLYLALGGDWFDEENNIESCAQKSSN
ncbi:MAG: NodT family efflux transporter outer membrane factor (OMF) lipoprotein [Rickettsiales bacterium]